jgi:hypothetical protein
MTEIKPRSSDESERIEELLKAAVPRTADEAEPARDLWPDVLRRMDREPVSVPWFDWALVGGLVALVVAFPSAVPVILYYM